MFRLLPLLVVSFTLEASLSGRHVYVRTCEALHTMAVRRSTAVQSSGEESRHTDEQYLAALEESYAPACAERKRLLDSQLRRADWKNWGPYVSDRYVRLLCSRMTKFDSKRRSNLRRSFFFFLISFS